MMPFEIPIYKPTLDGNESKYVKDCIETTWISSKGKYLSLFEKKLSNYLNDSFCTTTSNGTTSLHLALLALKITTDDEVITTNYTYVASTNAIKMVGAKPIFCDINPHDLNINADLIEEKITNKTKAILVTNVYGFLADFEKINILAKKHNLYVIEDAAESLGSFLNEKPSGTLADISTFSFFGNKTITTGEGGMVVCKKEKHLKLINQLKNQGNSESRVYYHDLLGYNYRMTNIQAAIGYAQLEYLESILDKKKRVYLYYKNNLRKEIQFLEEMKSSRPSYWMTPIIFKSINKKIKVERSLNDQNIETRPFFTPIDLLPFYQTSKCKVAKSIYERGLLLPSYPNLTFSELDKVCNIINNEL